jgi:peptidoglycan/LPS O-acetylase OafA/YrhL
MNKSTLLSIALLNFFLTGLLVLWAGDIGKVFNDVFSAIGFLYFSIFLYSALQNRLTFLKRALIFIGHISYELYLLHMVIFLLVKDFLDNVISLHPSVVYSFLFVLPLAILMSVLFMRLTRRFYQSPVATRLL